MPTQGWIDAYRTHKTRGPVFVPRAHTRAVFTHAERFLGDRYDLHFRAGRQALPLGVRAPAPRRPPPDRSPLGQRAAGRVLCHALGARQRAGQAPPPLREGTGGLPRPSPGDASASGGG